MNPRPMPILDRVMSYITSYVSFSSPDYVLAGALWAAATHLWPDFDAFPYLCITASTKRSGKTRFSEILSFLVANPMNVAGVTAAALFRSIADEKPTIFIDEAENQGGESADLIRTVLNVGYRRGQTIPRTTKGGKIAHYPVYCPKAFILIGDVRDTLRDRSIVIRMQRAEAPQRFLWNVASEEGNALRAELADLINFRKADIMDAYLGHSGLAFLPDRDEEIWLALFAVCAIIAPERLEELKRVSVDIATEKTMEARTISKDELREAEQAANDREYAVRLVLDLRTVLEGKKFLWSQDALEALKALPTGPWRKYKGEGLDLIQIGYLLKRFGTFNRSIKAPAGSKHAGTVRRGFTKADIDGIIEREGLDAKGH